MDLNLVWAALLAWSALATMHPIVLGDEAFYLLPALFGYTAENLERWGHHFQIPVHLFFRLYGLERWLLRFQV